MTRDRVTESARPGLWGRLKRLAKSRLGFHFVPMPWLGEQLAAAGYRDFEWAPPGGWFAYASAKKWT